MNTFTMTNRTIARVFAFVAVLAMVASAFAPLSVAHAEGEELVPVIPEQDLCLDDSADNYNEVGDCIYTPDIPEVDDQTPNYKTIEVCKYEPYGDEQYYLIEGWGFGITNVDDEELDYNLTTGEDGCVTQVVDANDGPWFVVEGDIEGWTYVEHYAYNGDTEVIEDIPTCIFFDGEWNTEADSYNCTFYNVENAPATSTATSTPEEEEEENEHNGGNGSGECEIEGHKYDQDGNPLVNWVMGLMKIRTYEDDSSNTFDLAADTTDEDGYYCLEWDGEAGLPEGEETTPYKSFIYYVYEVLVDGWENVSVEKGASVSELAVVPDEEVFDLPVDRVAVQVGEENGYIYKDAAYHVDFYNTQDGDGGNGTSTDGRFTLTVTITGEGEGGVTGSTTEEALTINCHSSNGELIDCSETYASGTVVTLVATADEGSNFDNSWTAGFGTCTGNTTPCQVVMTQNVDLIAHFDKNSNGGGGGGGGRSSGRSNNNDNDDDDDDTPEGEVLGDQVTVVPEGAPDTGAGGAAPIGVSFAPYLGIVARRFVR